MIPTWQSSYKDFWIINQCLPYKSIWSSLFRCKFIYSDIEKYDITDIFYLAIDSVYHALNDYFSKIVV